MRRKPRGGVHPFRSRVAKQISKRIIIVSFALHHGRLSNLRLYHQLPYFIQNHVGSFTASIVVSTVAMCAKPPQYSNRLYNVNNPGCESILVRQIHHVKPTEASETQRTKDVPKTKKLNQLTAG